MIAGKQRNGYAEMASSPSSHGKLRNNQALYCAQGKARFNDDAFCRRED
jgi:hypothetical protein